MRLSIRSSPASGMIRFVVGDLDLETRVAFPALMVEWTAHPMAVSSKRRRVTTMESSR